jgi:rubrerythrin
MSAVHTTGETPGAGTYYCLVCGWRITLEDDQVMPVCGGCVRPVISSFSHLR